MEQSLAYKSSAMKRLSVDVYIYICIYMHFLRNIGLI